LTVIAAAMTRTFELVFTRLPVGRAAEMRAARIDNEQAIGRAIHPDAIFLLPLGIDAESVVSRISDLERSGRLKKCPREKEAEESDEPGGQKRAHHTPGEYSSASIDGIVFWADCGHSAGCCGLRCPYGRRANVACRFSSSCDRSGGGCRARRRRRGRTCRRRRGGCRRSCLCRFAKQGGYFRICEGRQILPLAARLFGSNG